MESDRRSFCGSRKTRSRASTASCTGTALVGGSLLHQGQCAHSWTAVSKTLCPQQHCSKGTLPRIPIAAGVCLTLITSYIGKARQRVLHRVLKRKRSAAHGSTRLHAVQRGEHERAAGPGQVRRLLGLQRRRLRGQAAHLPARHRQRLRRRGAQDGSLRARGSGRISRSECSGCNTSLACIGW